MLLTKAGLTSSRRLHSTAQQQGLLPQWRCVYTDLLDTFGKGEAPEPAGCDGHHPKPHQQHYGDLQADTLRLSYEVMGTKDLETI